MSNQKKNIPTFLLNSNDLENLLGFIYNQEDLLKQFGGIKLQLNSDCKLSLKKRRKNLNLRPMKVNVIQSNMNKCIYEVNSSSLSSTDQCVEMNDPNEFWHSLSNCKDKSQPLNISFASDVSFFARRKSSLSFDLNRIPNESLLKLVKKKKWKDQCIEGVRRAHGPGSIFPLTCGKQRLFRLDYHHEGGNHHWYIIPHSQRDRLQKLINNCNYCLDHGQIFVDPSILDQHEIRYFHCIQQPNEFVVFSAGSLCQSFSTNSSWSESVVFALPSWIIEGHASSLPTCQCQTNSFHSIDYTLFTTELIHKYIQTSLNLQTSFHLHSLDLSQQQQQQQQQQDTTSLQDLTFDETNEIFMDLLSNCDYDYDLLSFDKDSVCIDLYFTQA